MALGRLTLACLERKTLDNQSGYITTIYYWGTIEAGMTVIAACLPTLGPLIRPRRRVTTDTPTSLEGTRIGSYLQRLANLLSSSQSGSTPSRRWYSSIGDNDSRQTTGSGTALKSVTRVPSYDTTTRGRTEADAYPLQRLDTLSDSDAEIPRAGAIEDDNVVVTTNVTVFTEPGR
ncbi:MAG: hypothetical protein Q9159_000907 [Coniocarpon cinnabarinum]